MKQEQHHKHNAQQIKIHETHKKHNPKCNQQITQTKLPETSTNNKHNTETHNQRCKQFTTKKQTMQRTSTKPKKNAAALPMPKYDEQYNYTTKKQANNQTTTHCHKTNKLTNNIDHGKHHVDTLRK
jgi:hypothetical protein